MKQLGVEPVPMGMLALQAVAVPGMHRAARRFVFVFVFGGKQTPKRQGQ